MGQNNVFKQIPILTDAKVIKHKTSHAPSSSTEDNTILSPSSSPSNSDSPPAGCINYNLATRTISVGCGSARLTDIDNKLHDSNLLAKVSPTGTWFLSANLVISKGATFYIDSTDTKWLSGGAYIRLDQHIL